jgi:hypothetical protein
MKYRSLYLLLGLAALVVGTQAQVATHTASENHR